MKTKWSAVRGFLILVLGVFLVSCSPDTEDSKDRERLTGILIDAPVEGVAYATNSNISDVTTNEGEYFYYAGDIVTFSIGSIELGEVEAKKQITPIDLVEDPHLANRKVVNILRFLQTLDDDRNPDNGITISESVQNAAVNLSIDFDQSPTDFENSTSQTIATLTEMTSAGASPLVSAASAVDHFIETLESVQDGIEEEEILTVVRPPTDMVLDGDRLLNLAEDSAIGTVSAIDEDTGDSHTFTLLPETLDNHLFSMEGNTLKVGQSSLTLEGKDAYQVRIKATDLTALSYEKSFTIQVNQVRLTLSEETIAENAGTVSVSAVSEFAVESDMTIHLTTQGSSAENTEYHLSASELIILSGSTTASPITITSVNDEANDDDETISVAIQSIEGPGIPASTQTVTTIVTDDDDLPAVVSLFLEDNATNVPLDTNLVITMSETVTAMSGKNITIHKASDDSIVAIIDAGDTTQVTVVDNVITIDPSANFLQDTEFYITIEAGAFVDSANDPYPGITTPTEWNFTTADVPVLTLVSGIVSETNDVTPSVTFTSSQPGDILYSGGCLDSTTSRVTTADTNTTITFDALTEGSHQCTLAVRNALGFDSLTPLTFNFTVDTTSPSLSEITAVSTPTNDTTPAYTFSGTEGGTLSHGGACSSTTSNVPSGNTTVTFNTLAEGDYTDCTLTITDGAGNVSDPLTITPFTIDTTAPSLSEGTAVPTPANDTTPDYTFTTTEAGTIVYGSICDSTTTTAIVGSNTVTLNALSDGTYADCTIQVTDEAGNESSALGISAFTIDATAPVLIEGTPVTTPASDTTPDYVFSSTKVGTITYNGSCSSTTTTASVGNNTVTFDTLADGTYVDCTITVTDAVNNESTALSVSTFIVDTTSPSLSEITAVSTPTNDTTPAYTFSGTEGGTLSHGGACSSTTSNVPSGNTTVTFNTLAEGDYTDCTLTITDGAGNVSDPLTITPFTIDTTAPSLSEGTAVPTPANDTTPDYIFTSTEAGAIVYGGVCGSTTTTAIVGNNTVTLNALSDGTYADCTIQVTDEAGNESSALGISAFTIDATAPALTEGTPVTTPSGDTTPDYIFSSTEAGTIAYGGSCSSSITLASVGNNTVTFDTLADGTYVDCTITVTDAVNNESTALSVSTFTVDTTAPTLSETTAVSTPTNDTTPDYTFSSSESGSVAYGGSCSSDTTTANEGNNTITFNLLTDDTYADCTIKVTDSVNNESLVLSVSPFTIETVAPTATLSPLDDATTIDVATSLVITFSETINAVSGKTITLKQATDDAVVGSAMDVGGAQVNVADNLVTITPSASLDGETEYYVEVEAGAFIDTAGNPYAGITAKGDWSFTTETTIVWETVGLANFTPGSASNGSFFMDNDTPYLAFQDQVNSFRLTVMKYNGTSWETVGSPGFSAGLSQATSIYVDNSIPYVAYKDGSQSNKATVAKFNGTSWETVGSAGFSESFINKVSLYVDSSTPYIAYDDGANDNKATVMKFNGTNWEGVGAAGISMGTATNPKIMVEGGTPYVAYRDEGNDNKAAVMKFNGTSWEAVGSSGVSAGTANYVSFDFDNGIPYLAYRDDANGVKVTVMKFNGTSWGVVGSTGFSPGSVTSTSLSVDNGAPYVGFIDATQSSKTTVMKFNGTSWELVGTAGFSPRGVYYMHLMVHNGAGYVAFQSSGGGDKATVMKLPASD